MQMALLFLRLVGTFGLGRGVNERGRMPSRGQCAILSADPDRPSTGQIYWPRGVRHEQL
jgi:hypothetical protein